MPELAKQDGNTELWYTVFAEGHPVLATKQRRYSMLPGSPRCKLCEAPFGGVGGWLMRRTGLHVSNRNPHYCNKCDGFLGAFPGGAEVPMAMMMIDIRNSVELSAKTSPKDFARLVMAMRTDVHELLDKTDGFVLEYQGDSVFAVWPPGFVNGQHCQKAIEAAELAARRASQHSHLMADIGVAVHTGTVYIGTVADVAGNMAGISAFGYDVNLLARLAHAARPGEVLVSTATYAAAGRPLPTQPRLFDTLKGIETPVQAISLGQPAMTVG